ncbi:MAG: hypothetical protein RL291_954, partial [Pseudomonadota bacterium]
LFFRLLRRLPVVGFAIHLLETENDKQLALLAANVVSAVFLGTVFFGSWVLLPVLYAAVAIVASAIFLATRG